MNRLMIIHRFIKDATRSRERRDDEHRYKPFFLIFEKTIAEPNDIMSHMSSSTAIYGLCKSHHWDRRLPEVRSFIESCILTRKLTVEQKTACDYVFRYLKFGVNHFVK